MRKRLGRERFGMIVGPPILILLVGGGWVIWRLNADLDDIEARQLEWSLLGTLFWQHLKVTAAAAVAVLVTAIPLGVLLTRPRFRRFSGPVIAIANAGQATPVIGLIVLLAMWIAFDFWTAVLALAIYAFLPVLRNTMVGLQQVDQTLVEAARGMGMSQMATLLRIEMPLAAPIIMAGVRTALVLVAGTASFAAFINAGGLGELITTGIKLFRYPVLVSGGILIALLALAFEWAGRLLEALLTPKGM